MGRSANRRKPKRSPPPPVSLGGVVEEQLPLPFVHYPGHYGTFFAFSESATSKPYMCRCSESAIAHYLALREQEAASSLHDRASHLDGLNLPNSIRLGPRASLSDISFRRMLCHRCNLIPPTERWCHEMYGVRFIQHFGWYVDQAYLRFGILPRSVSYLEDTTPQEFVEDIQAIKQAAANLRDASAWFREREEYTRKRIADQSLPPLISDEHEIAEHQSALRVATREHRQAERFLSKKIENIVREEFGFRPVGESWTSETLLHQIVSGIFEGLEILRHYRPDWLERLELDIFLPEIALAFEYQGQQHFHPVEAWGGEEALKEQIARDDKKASICRQRGITLIAVDYSEPLITSHIEHRLEEEFVGYAGWRAAADSGKRSN